MHTCLLSSKVDIISVFSNGIIDTCGHFETSLSTSSCVELALGSANTLARLDRMRECKS